jgi:hypothetical protein
MTIDNKHLHAFTWMVHLVTTILFVLFVFSVYLSSFYEKILPGIDKKIYIITGGILYLGILLYPNILRLHYIFYSDTGDSITVKTYPIGFFTSGKKSYAIPKKDFVRAELRESFFHLHKALILYQRIGGKGVAKYPPVYINGMPPEDRKKILLSLSRLMTAKHSALQQK